MNQGNSEEKKLSSFKRGNVNFDLLRPEGGIVRIEKAEEGDSSAYIKKSKRGQFDKNRKSNPVGIFYIASWIFMAFSSSVFIVFMIISDGGILWLATLPVAISVLLWSLVMLALIVARPR
ncbi:MAG: hypothetical protein OEZ34_07305 [Spirochaetia bacterium]|nr:hypothetical protein [Spirochaetia bacterium]